jgi:hypothetical protein
MLVLKHLGDIEGKDARLGETLRAIQNAINLHGALVGVDPSGIFPTPAAPSQITVTSVAGGFDVAIVDSNPQRGLVYFVEFDTTAGFLAPRTVPLHTTRNVYLPFGTATYFFRCYSQYQGSNPSKYTVFGGATPTAVVGGAPGTPVFGGTQGTGAGPSAGASPQPPVGAGFGPLTHTPPPRNLPGGRNTQ